MTEERWEIKIPASDGGKEIVKVGPLSRIEFLENELRGASASVFRKRKEIRHQKRQIEQWKEENPKAALRVKELENLRAKLARVRFNGENAAHERDCALEALAAVEAERDHWHERQLELTKRLTEQGREAIVDGC